MKKWFFSTPKLRFHTATLIGIGGRDNLEDALDHDASESRGCWVVADGVGGQQAGEVAANLAVHSILQACREGRIENLEHFVEAAHCAVARARPEHGPANGMATTLVALCVNGHRAVWAHVGDSRLYHFREGQILNKTEDHSLVNMLIARNALRPEDVAQFGQRHVILQALGQSDVPEICAVKPVQIKAGDGFLLCTDGVWELVSDAQFLEFWQTSASAQDWLDRIESTLLAAMQNKADADNYTAIAVRVVSA